MIKSFFLKESLKLRWIYLILLVLTIGFTLFIALRLNNRFVIQGAGSTWYRILAADFRFYDNLRYLPMVSGLAIAFFQFIPEIINRKLRLTYHLPVNISFSLFVMILTGLIAIASLFLLQMLILFLGTRALLPDILVWSTIISVLPWYLGGIMAYSLGVCLVLEPRSEHKVFILLIGGLSLLFPLTSGAMRSMDHVLPLILCLTICSLMAILYSGKRFEKFNE